ncbi:RNA polymerase sigma 54 factor RpoN [Gammaproteobacteria bacterium]|nr:RNA polymerase sigma 54 factor RpoN [Gammaproteobacteria bacterium]
MKITSNLRIKQTQNLSMSIGLQNAIKILQMTQLELNQEVNNLLESNIMLERDESIDESADEILSINNEQEYPINSQDNSTSLSNTENNTEINSERNNLESTSLVEALNSESSTSELSFDEPINHQVEIDWDGFEETEFSSLSKAEEQDNESYDIYAVHKETLQEALLWQLNLSKLSDLDRSIAEFLIDSIDINGYLRLTLEDALSSLKIQYPELEIDEIKAVLSRIQSFDPCGVGARSLQECLHIQLHALTECPLWIKTADIILNEHSILLEKLDLTTLQRKLKIDEQTLRNIIKGLKALNPKPGNTYAQINQNSYIPDILVEIKQDKIMVMLNPETIPKIRINKDYSKIISLSKQDISKQDNSVLKKHLNEANFFIKAVDTRFDTLLKVAKEIISYQKAYFFEGAAAIRSLQLKQIAEKLEIHESTVSRAVSGKYILCPHGMIELKFFFSTQMSKQKPKQIIKTNALVQDDNEDGDSSATAIRAAIVALVADEPNEKPHSDSKLVILLQSYGFNVARRTIAKYRDKLGILSSTERKHLD